jgi:hypothetical protein
VSGVIVLKILSIIAGGLVTILEGTRDEKGYSAIRPFFPENCSAVPWLKSNAVVISAGKKEI